MSGLGVGVGVGLPQLAGLPAGPEPDFIELEDGEGLFELEDGSGLIELE
jgi:hypothetical protein